jgi:hypothetical protein
MTSFPGFVPHRPQSAPPGSNGGCAFLAFPVRSDIPDAPHAHPIPLRAKAQSQVPRARSTLAAHHPGAGDAHT